MATQKDKIKVSKVTKNADSIVFAEAPFYTLAAVRRMAINLIVKVANDPKKVKAVAETLEVLKEFLDARSKHGADVRAKAVEAQEAQKLSLTKAAAEATIRDVEVNLRDSEAAVSKWQAAKDALFAGPKKEA